MTPTPQQPDVDTLSYLEERIQQTVDLVIRLRAELSETRAALEDATSQNMRLTGDLEAMQNERTMVRGRIEKLLGHIDQLG